MGACRACRIQSRHEQSVSVSGGAHRAGLLVWSDARRGPADHGHCLEIDIREQHPRSRRRLVQIVTGDLRAALDRVARMFDAVEAKGVAGQEGNYRQRLYRFRSLMTECRYQRGASSTI